MADVTVDEAVEIATAAHHGQTDKAGVPYIQHPLAVMALLDGDEARMLGVLHDVMEDTDPRRVTGEPMGDALSEEGRHHRWTALLRGRGCPDAVISGLIAITRRRGQSSEDYYRAVASHPLALRVKRDGDIAHNADPARLAALRDPATRERLQRKYEAAMVALASTERGDLGGVPSSGDPPAR